MGFLDKLLGRAATAPAGSAPDHAHDHDHDHDHSHDEPAKEYGWKSAEEGEEGEEESS